MVGSVSLLSGKGSLWNTGTLGVVPAEVEAPKGAAELTGILLGTDLGMNWVPKEAPTMGPNSCCTGV